MKRYLSLFAAWVTLFLWAASAHAILIDLGGGMIYDQDLNITWLADANTAGAPMTWADANSWALNLVYGGYDDWRLPTTLQPDSSCSFQSLGGTFSLGNSCTGSEMGHLFYNELGGTAGSSILSSSDPDLALFTNIQADGYWSGTEFDTSNAWYFLMDNGDQNFGHKSDEFPLYAWAVRDGGATDPSPSPSQVPEPGTLLLMGSGIAGLIGFGRKKKETAGE